MADTKDELIEVVVEEEHVGQRLDAFLASMVPHISRSKMRKILDSGNITTTGQSLRAKDPVVEGDVYKIRELDKATTEIKPVDMNLVILFEDDDLIVIDKPVGLAVHPGAGEPENTLVHGLLFHSQDLSRAGLPQDRPGIVHRLDKDTSGVIVCAKNDESHAFLAKQFQEKTNTRVYLALINGFVKQEKFRVESYIRRDPDNRLKMKSITKDDFEVLRSHSASSAKACKFAASKFTRIATYRERLSLMEIQLETGRTHQIRVHAQAIGMSVIGDMRYGAKCFLPTTFSKEVIKYINQTSRQMLHAKILGFVHPRTLKEMRFESQLPQDFADVLAVLEPHKDI